MTDAEARQFVLDFCDGKIFTDRDIPQGTPPTQVFMVLGFAPLIERSFAEKIGLVWEHYHAGGRAGYVNGCPIFLSCRIMHADDLARVQPVIEAEIKRREEVRMPERIGHE